VLVVVLALQNAHPALGATIQVTTTAQGVSNDGECGLQEAVIAANTNASLGGCNAGQGAVDTILVPNDTYIIGFGDIQVTNPVIIRGGSRENTVLDSAGFDRIFRASGINADLTLENMTLRNGAATGPGFTDSRGGAVYANSDLTLDNVIIEDSVASRGGGAVANDATSDSDSFTITNSIIRDNRTTETGAGAGVYSATHLTVTDSVIENNIHETDGFSAGGGIDAEGALSTRNLVITDTVISGNRARIGGGLATTFIADLTNVTVMDNEALQSGGGLVFINEQATLTDSTVTGNQAALTLGSFAGAGIVNAAPLTISGSTISNNGSPIGGHGGGIINGGNNPVAAVLVISDSVIEGNQTAPDRGGGGIYNSMENASVFLADTVITNNSAGNGGGIWNEGTLSVISTSLTGNTAATTGGGIDNAADADIDRTLIHDNTAPQGAGVFTGEGGSSTLTSSSVVANDGPGVESGAGGSTTLRNVTLTAGSPGIVNAGSVHVRNTIIAEGDPNCSGDPIASDGYNIEDAADCGLSGPGDKPNTDPLLGPLADNGGATMTRALLEDSPAIDAGAPTQCPLFDQRGELRPQGNACDVGAYESEGSAPVPTGTPLPEAIQGDVNCDGLVDEADFLLLAQYPAGLFDGNVFGPCPNFLDNIAATGFPWADVNCDNAVNLTDALFLVAYLANIHLPQAVGNCFDIGSAIT